MSPADHVEHGLAFFLADDFESALQRRQNLLRIVDHFAVAAVGGDNHFVTRRGGEIAQGKIVRAHGPTVWHDLLRCRFGGMPDRVVANDRQHGKIVRLRDEMTGGRVVEHVSSVADAGNHSFLGVGEFHAQGATNAPA